jgi:hypothetical protein
MTEREPRIRAHHEKIHLLITNRDEQAVRIDARGLPLMAAGVFLSVARDRLAGFYTRWVDSG